MPTSVAHPGHMTNVEADVIEEMLRQREAAHGKKQKQAGLQEAFEESISHLTPEEREKLIAQMHEAAGDEPAPEVSKAKKKEAEEQNFKMAMAYLLSLPEGPDIVKRAVEQGEFLAEKVAAENPELAAQIVKEGIEFQALKPFLGNAGQTALDIERAAGPAVLKGAVGRAMVMGPAGYAAGQMFGDTPKKKELYSKIGLGIGVGGAGLNAASRSGAISKELDMLKLLERGTGVAGSEVGTMGTSLSREDAIRRAAKDLAKETAPAPAKTATIGEPEMHGNVIKIADDGQTRSYIMGLDAKASGSLSYFLEKTAQAGWARPFLAGAGEAVPWGRMAAGGVGGALVGSFVTPHGSKNEGRNATLGFLGGAGLMHGLAPGVAQAEGAVARNLAGASSLRGAGGAYTGISGKLGAGNLLSSEARSANRQYGSQIMRDFEGRGGAKSVTEIEDAIRAHPELGRHAKTPHEMRAILRDLSESHGFHAAPVGAAGVSPKGKPIAAPTLGEHTADYTAAKTQADLMDEARQGINMDAELKPLMRTGANATPQAYDAVHQNIARQMANVDPTKRNMLASKLMKGHFGSIGASGRLDDETFARLHGDSSVYGDDFHSNAYGVDHSQA
jgi:hypothetical protein